MFYCPKCRYEYKSGLTKCPECNEKLVNQLPEKSEEDNREFVLISTYISEAEAQFAKTKLEAHGINAIFVNEIMSQVDMSIAWAQGGAKLVVMKKDAKRAIQILADED